MLIIQIALGIVLGFFAVRGVQRFDGWRQRRAWQKRMTSLREPQATVVGEFLALWPLWLLIMGCALLFLVRLA